MKQAAVNFKYNRQAKGETFSMQQTEKTTSDYWNTRADREYRYKNEKFYTITPIPYYYLRRKIILKKIKTLMDGAKCRSVCDFGCGDGEYIAKLKRENIEFYGVDASPKMIELARARVAGNIHIQYEISSQGITSDKKFDMIYSSAIWAHIHKEDIQGLYANIYKHLSPKGYFIICEQSAPYYYEGNNYIRRTTEQYVNLLEDAGFEIADIEIIDFWLHRILFEKYFVKKYVGRKKFIHRDQDELKIELNKNKVYRFFSLILAKLSIPCVFKGRKNNKIINRWGYSFIVAIKR